jgi:ATP-dependent exoDNAse (exonuclease V) beta subunit
MTSGNKRAIGHLAILASAGSGKTTRLTHRYLQLLADKDLEANPGRICALTFTRKAAGEIFDRIVECLCKGAAGSAGAAEMASRISRPGLDEREFGRLLGLFLDNLHRAMIGTMDSFVFGVARAFPVELGIPMDFQAADTDKAEGKAMRQAILADILAARGGGASGFLEAFKKATFGAEEKGAEELLNELMSKLHLSYRLCPDKAKWGNAQLIWPGKAGALFRIYGEEELRDRAEIIREWICKNEQEKTVIPQFLESLRTITGALTGYGLATPWDNAFKGVIFDQLLANREALRAGSAVFSYRSKNMEITSPVAGALALLLDNLVAVEVKRALEKTAGLHDLLEYYDIAYEKLSRESGRFSFTDIQYLLALGDISRNAAVVSRKQGEGRLFIDYRLDARLDHWLLDEFQDTSDLQWAIFRNLVSELVQGDPEGRARSFFYVGDVKQSIYRWRGGNPGLFLEIQRQYNRAGPVIRPETISETYRCSPPVVEAVNKVFSSLPDDCLPEETVAAWKTVWKKHETLNKKAPGYVALLQHEPGDDPDEARCRLVADLLNEIQPVKRGIGVGILTRDNGACVRLVNVLRRECPGMGFVHEGKSAIIENELALVILALVRLAAHPGDEFAWQHVLMSPLAEALKKENIDRNNISTRMLADIESRGFHAFIMEWGNRLDKVCALNAYGRQCLARLEKAAAAFDAAGSRRCNRFLQFVEDYEVQEEPARGSVRIMTIHQAKGLGFDMVVLPQLQHRTKMNMARAERADKEMLYGGKPFEPEWILKSPKMDIAESDPVLGARIRELDARHCFDWLCLLYVAMTRAKNALYLVTSPEPKSDTLRPSSFLKLQLAGKADPATEPCDESGGALAKTGESGDLSAIAQRATAEAKPATETGVMINHKACARLYASVSGDEKWYETFPEISAAEKAAAPAAPGAGDFAKRKSRRDILERSEPSRQESFERKASDLFDPETRDVLDFGSAIHELFEKVEWLDPEADAEAIIRDWLPSKPYDQKVHDDVLKQFRKCLGSREVRQALARPEGSAEVWREKSFEIIMNGQWISGVFDRVVIVKDGKGRPARAAIMDFKSNRGLNTEVEMRNRAAYYRPQMELYRRALSRILGLAEDLVSTQLLFTVPARILRQ